MIITQKELRRIIHYSPDTGVFTRIIVPAKRTERAVHVGCTI